MDFLWHKVSKDAQEKIRKEAKHVMDSFAKALAKVEHEKVTTFPVEREKQARKESKTIIDSDFRKAFFANVPLSEGDFVKAEKGKWI